MTETDRYTSILMLMLMATKLLSRQSAPFFADIRWQTKWIGRCLLNYTVVGITCVFRFNISVHVLCFFCYKVHYPSVEDIFNLREMWSYFFIFKFAICLGCKWNIHFFLWLGKMISKTNASKFFFAIIFFCWWTWDSVIQYAIKLDIERVNNLIALTILYDKALDVSQPMWLIIFWALT